jgi:hypothetical protein
MKARIFFICLIIFISACKNEVKEQISQNNQVSVESLSINLDHLDHLYKEVKLPNGKDAAIIHIYADYPTYNYDIEPKEGFTCVDDVARAIVFLSGEKGTAEKIIRLTEFLLYMQNENGWFNNFIWKDLSINRTYQTTVAEPSWWSWRALWALERGLPRIQTENPELAARVTSSIDILIENIKTYLAELPHSEEQVSGLSVATDLPHGSASDQASILLIGLCHHFQRTNDVSIKPSLRQLAEGILKMQVKDGVVKGMFRSWKNAWHAYANTQSYALLLTGNALNEQSYINAALQEVDSFFPYLLKTGFLSELTVESKNGSTHIMTQKEFSQIAYGVRPIVYAYVKAYRQTNDEKYKIAAAKWLAWFAGENVASAKMYDSTTGRCFDGIQAIDVINKNSGAESTIEALLSIQAFESIK